MMGTHAHPYAIHTYILTHQRMVEKCMRSVLDLSSMLCVQANYYAGYPSAYDQQAYGAAYAAGASEQQHVWETKCICMYACSVCEVLCVHFSSPAVAWGHITLFLQAACPRACLHCACMAPYLHAPIPAGCCTLNGDCLEGCQVLPLRACTGPR